MSEVGCAGILVADTVCGPMDALPVEGQLLALDALPVHAGGCAANVAIGLAKQGIPADVAGRLGKDASAQIVMDTLRKAGVDCGRITFSDTQPSSQTIMLLVKGQDRRFIHVFGANKEFSIEHIDFDWVSKLKVFYLGGLFVLPAIQTDALLKLLQICRSKGIITVVDVVIPHHQQGLAGLELLLPYIDYFVPNDDEAALLTGVSEPLDQIRVFQTHGANTIIITRGEKGTVAAKGHEVWHADAFKVATIDPSGSGDAFTAGIITGILRGWDMPRTLAYGGALGASATFAIGTTTGVFTASEADAFLARNSVNIAYTKET